MNQSKFTLVKILTILCFCLLLMSFTTNSAFATNVWIGGVGYWNVPTNWSNGIPNDTEEVKIRTELDICTVYTAVPSLINNKIAIARDAKLVIDSGGYLESGRELKVGDAGASGSGTDIGYLHVKGGQLDITGSGKLQIGYKTGGDGRCTISGGSITGATGRMYIGGANQAGAIGKVTIQGSAATINQQSLYVGASDSVGTNPGDGTLEFQIDSSGVSPIQVSDAYLDPGGVNSTADLVLSLTSTPPPEKDILLISGTVTGTFDTVNGAPAPEGTLVILNYGGNGYCYRLTYAGSVVLKWAPAAVSFSVNGPADPHYDGIWGLNQAMFIQPWTPMPGGTPVGFGPFPPIRLPAVTWAIGISTFRPGDVFDYAFAAVRSEGEIFQSEPNTSAGGASNAPNGTNNQILQAVALGLSPGDPCDQSNVNAYSFGEDFFNGDEQPQNPGPVESYEWEYRTSGGFTEPRVAGGGLPIKFYFSVDPWAIGLAGTAVRSEATLAGALTLPVGPMGAADEDWNPPAGAPPYGQGPWNSEGEASGDVFSSEPITIAGTNIQVHDEAILALLAPKPPIDIPDMEDDLDALENAGTNMLYNGTAAEPGNTHDRVDDTQGMNGGTHPPDLGDPFNPNHDPNNGNPIIFSVDRGTYGAPGSAVNSQVMIPNEGASGDLFIAVTIWDMFNARWVTTNMLLIDDGQLGLMPHDDLDAVIVKLLIDPCDLAQRIENAAGNFDEAGSFGTGFTLPLLNAGEAVVGFSVDTSSIGLVGSAVDFECRVDGGNLPGAVPPASGVMEQAGDIFYADLLPVGPGVDTGTLLRLSTNYLWFEERALGLDRGTWSLPAPPGINAGDLGELPDELNALDSDIGKSKVVEHLKWSQPPTEIDPNLEIPIYSGWDEISHRQRLEPEYWRIVADDFRCLGNMPISSIHWWGSHFDYEWWWGHGILPPTLPIAWKIGFWSNVPADPTGQVPFSYPETLLWLIEVPASRVYWEEVGSDSYHGFFPEDICYQYYLDLEPNEWFWQGNFEPDTNDHVFWLSISAIYDPCETPPPLYWWGWKTKIWHWMDDAVSFYYDGPLAPGVVLDPINNGIDPIEDPLYYESVDVAFELDTEPNYIKWEQPFTGIRDWPHYEDVPSEVAIFPDYWDWDQAVADDWYCTDPLPITAMAWWGSYIGYRFQPCHGPFMTLPDPPDYFWISIWTDTPDPDPCDPFNWSHPNDIIWQYDAYDYDEVLVGYDKDPRDTNDPPREPVFRYSVRIPEPNWFWQDPNSDRIYWLLIAAAYVERYPDPFYYWGWTLHKHVFHDDAVYGEPFINDGEHWEWYEVYDQMGDSADMSFILFTDPNAEPPQPEIDFGDANDPCYPTLLVNDGARHIIDGPWLGPGDDSPDPEGDGQPDPVALGDDNDGNDDEDGVFIPVLYQALPGQILVLVSDPAGLGGFVELWIDFDGSGSWEAGELVHNAWLGTGPNLIPVTAPFGSVVGQTFARCRISTLVAGTGSPTGLAPDGEVEDHEVIIAEAPDYGDADDPPYPTLLVNDGARHIIGTPLWLGPADDSPDPEGDGQPDPTALGDDNDSNDDEDGVTIPVLTQGIPTNITVEVYEAAGGVGFVELWIDFDGSGSWEAGELVQNGPLPTGPNPVPVTAPIGSVVGQTFARCRISSNGTGSPTGLAMEGEVEDHEVTIEAGLDFGDANDPPYPTLLANDGARHTIVPRVMLGASIDAETDGQPNAAATGDDNDGNDDEDGVVFTSLLVPGQQATVTVTTSVPGILNAWIDFHGDGDWSDTVDQIFNDQVLPIAGPNPLMFTVPASAVGNIDTFARFRFDTAGGLEPNGPADDGEVEDYKVHIEHKIKWSQPPFEDIPGAGEYYGWDEKSIYHGMQIVADDWPCEDQRPVSDVHWWGSYFLWNVPGELPPPPFLPIGFHIGIWTDVPPGVDRPFSHPNDMIWEYSANIAEVHEEYVGRDVHPDYPQDSCFKYTLQLPEPNWFWQDPNENSIYWISIAAVYDLEPQEYYWGWKTRPNYFMDDAVRIWIPTAPVVGDSFIEGEPIENHEGSWDMAFELTTRECLIGGYADTPTEMEYDAWAAWGYPKCWCYCRQCRGDIDGLKIGPYWVQALDLALFRAAFNKMDPVLPPGGICADLDHRKIGPYRVQAIDLKLFRTYFNKRPPDPNTPIPCDQIHPTNPYVPWQTALYVGPFNFWCDPTSCPINCPP